MSDTNISNESVTKATGRGWSEWFSIMDEWGAVDKGHKAIAAWLHNEQGVSAWWSQMVTVEYERKRGLRQVNERSKGFGTSVQRTVKTTIDRAWNAWADPAELSSWFTTNAQQDFIEGGRYSNGDNDSGEFKRIVNHKLIRFTWEQKHHQPGSEVEVTFNERVDGKVVIRLQHEKLAIKKDTDDLKEGWSWAMDSLKSYLETGKKITWEEWK